MRSRQKLPSVAAPLRPAIAADQRDRDGDADRRRDEVLHRQPGHLAEVGHRRLAAVVLPVRVRDERRDGVERDVPGAEWKPCGLQRVRASACAGSGRAASQTASEKTTSALRVLLPVLAAAGLVRSSAVAEALGRREDRGQEHALAGEDARHVAAEERRRSDDEARGRARSGASPCRIGSEPLPAQQRVEEVDERRAPRRRAISVGGAHTRSSSVDRGPAAATKNDEGPGRWRRSPCPQCVAAARHGRAGFRCAGVQILCRRAASGLTASVGEAVPDAGIGADVARPVGRARSCAAGWRCARAGRGCRRRTPGPTPRSSSARWVISRPRLRASVAADRTRSASGGPPRRRAARCARRGRSRGRRRSARGSPARLADPAQRGLQPGDQLARPERLRDVVVGAGLQRADLRVLLADGARARGSASALHSRSRRQTSMPSPSGSTRSTIAASGGRTAARVERLLGRLGGHRLEAGLAQHDLQRAQDLRLVVADQDRARRSLTPRRPRAGR